MLQPKNSITRATTRSLLLCCVWRHVLLAATVVSAFASSSSHETNNSIIYHKVSSTIKPFMSHRSVSGMVSLPFHCKTRRSNYCYQGGNHHHHHHHGLHLFSIPRGGGGVSETLTVALTSKVSQWTSTPSGAFNLVLALLGMSTAFLKLYNRTMLMSNNNDNDDDDDDDKGQNNNMAVVVRKEKDPKVQSLQLRFLTVFWLLRMADWLQGPYFYQVYASKNFDSVTTSAFTKKTSTSSSSAVTWVSRLFLTGFASTALFGPLVGRMCDTYGRKAGTLAFSILYSLGAISTKSNILGVLLLGRVMGGIGTSLLFSAPEAWLVGEAGKLGVESCLGETFGLAYAGDSIVAILAGQMAGFSASTRGPTGPFELSVAFLSIGAVLASFMWKENVAGGVGIGQNDGNEKMKSKNDSIDTQKPTIRDAMKVVKSDPKIMLVGAIQSLFEAAMYIFVLNWPPAVSKAIGAYFSQFPAAKSASTGMPMINTPYGTVFSCFMACCLLGSTLFGQLTSTTKVDKSGKSKAISAESFAVGMLGLAALAMGSATLSISSSTSRVISSLASLPVLSTILSPIANVSGKLATSLMQPGAVLSILMLSLFCFESCVGMYFPTIGTLRSKYFPDSHRSVVMNLFGIPLNIMVVSVFLSIERLGVQGALGMSTAALSMAAACGYQLKRLVKDSEVKD